MSLLAVTLFALACSLAAGQSTENQDFFMSTFRGNVNGVRNQQVYLYGPEFKTGEKETATFNKVFVSMYVKNATLVPHAVKVLVRGAPKEYTYYEQKYIINAVASADFVGTLENGQAVKSYVIVPEADIGITLNVDFNEFNKQFSATETEFDISKYVTVLVRGAPEKVLVGGTIQVTDLPEGVSEAVRRYAVSHFTETIRNVIKSALDNAVYTLNH